MILIAASLMSNKPYIPPQDNTEYDTRSSRYLILEGSHLMRSKAPGGEMLALEDGALFDVDSSSAPIVMHWDLNQPVKLSCRISHLFSSYNLYLTDTIDSQVYAYIKLLKAPDKNDPMVSRVFHIDCESGRLYIRDRQHHETLWQVEQTALKTLHSWNHGDSVVLGINDSWAHKMVGVHGFFLINYDHLSRNLPTAYLPVTKVERASE